MIGFVLVALALIAAVSTLTIGAGKDLETRGLGAIVAIICACLMAYLVNPR